MAYLDASGLTEVWAKCKAWFGRRLTANAATDSVTVTLLNNAGDAPSSITDSQNVATIPAATTSLAGVMTASDKSKLNGIASGAEVNVQADWSVTSTSSDAYIKNKPTIPDSTSDLTNDSGFITSAAIPSASDTAPAMDGTAAAGTGTTWARADHVHPTDTSRASASALTATDNLAKRNSNLWHAICEDSPSTAYKTAMLDGDASDFALAMGVSVAVTFTYGNSSVQSYLNINGTGSKLVSIPTSGSADSTQGGTTYNTWGRYETILFTYSGSHWVHAGSGLTQYSAYTLASQAAPKASPALTGTPTAPTAAAGTDSTQIATTEFVNDAIGTAIAGIQGISYEVVTSLPATGSAGVIYLVSNGGSGQNSYDEYIWLGSSYEKIGTTAVDLSGYWSKTELVAMTTAEVDAICV